MSAKTSSNQITPPFVHKINVQFVSSFHNISVRICSLSEHFIFFSREIVCEELGLVCVEFDMGLRDHTQGGSLLCGSIEKTHILYTLVHTNTVKSYIYSRAKKQCGMYDKIHQDKGMLVQSLQHKLHKHSSILSTVCSSALQTGSITLALESTVSLPLLLIISTYGI